MWTISKQQLEGMAATKRSEFERQACKRIMKRNESPYILEKDVRDIVHSQTNHIIMYGFTQMDAIIQFFELSISYPQLRTVPLPEEVINILDSPDKQSEKINKLRLWLSLTPKNQE